VDRLINERTGVMREIAAAPDNDWHSRAFGVLENPVVDIVGVRLDAPAEVSAALWQLLSRDEQERARKFRYAEHRQHYIVARASLRRLLAGRLRIAPRRSNSSRPSTASPDLRPCMGPQMWSSISRIQGFLLFMLLRAGALSASMSS
jgi:phosphopantetheinyl transferase